MTRLDRHGQVQTVLGLIAPEELGVTLPHEHFLVDSTVWFREPTACSEKFLAHQPVNLENLGWVRYHPMSNLDNMLLDDERVAIDEGLRFKYAGGGTVVDLTSLGLGRDPLALARISRATGLNVVMGCGYYVEEAQRGAAPLTEDAITDSIVRDLEVGVDATGIRAGIIGEIGIGGWPMRQSERSALQAVAHAQQETGAPVNIHPGNSPNSPFEIVEVLLKAGADITRVVISHVERTIVRHEVYVELAKSGCYLEFDGFSFEGWYQRRMVVSEENPIKADFPNDAGRIDEIMALISDGFLTQILISHDHCMKYRLWRYGGPGYSHLLDNVMPLMQEKGLQDSDIREIMLENPKRLLPFA
jgi:phosphotriesterase-related protein